MHCDDVNEIGNACSNAIADLRSRRKDITYWRFYVPASRGLSLLPASVLARSCSVGCCLRDSQVKACICFAKIVGSLRSVTWPERRRRAPKQRNLSGKTTALNHFCGPRGYPPRLSHSQRYLMSN